jgi:hypothetical protein
MLHCGTIFRQIQHKTNLGSFHGVPGSLGHTEKQVIQRGISAPVGDISALIAVRDDNTYSSIRRTPSQPPSPDDNVEPYGGGGPQSLPAASDQYSKVNKTGKMSHAAQEPVVLRNAAQSSGHRNSYASIKKRQVVGLLLTFKFNHI